MEALSAFLHVPFPGCLSEDEDNNTSASDFLDRLKRALDSDEDVKQDLRLNLRVTLDAWLDAMCYTSYVSFYTQDTTFSAKFFRAFFQRADGPVPPEEIYAQSPVAALADVLAQAGLQGEGVSYAAYEERYGSFETWTRFEQHVLDDLLKADFPAEAGASESDEADDSDDLDDSEDADDIDVNDAGHDVQGNQGRVRLPLALWG